MTNQFSEEGYEFSFLGPPDTPGVYVVCMAELEAGLPLNIEPVYVGSSKNIQQRVLSHNHIFRQLYDKYHPTHYVSVCYFETDDYKEEEVRMIKKYAPKFNKQHKPIGL